MARQDATQSETKLLYVYYTAVYLYGIRYPTHPTCYYYRNMELMWKYGVNMFACTSQIKSIYKINSQRHDSRRFTCVATAVVAG